MKPENRKTERIRGLCEASEQIKLLQVKWPVAFPTKSHEVRPLASGTVQLVATEFGWSANYARAVLEWWKQRNAYCRAVLSYTKRINIDGSESDEDVKEEARLHARSTIELREQRRLKLIEKEKAAVKKSAAA